MANFKVGDRVAVKFSGSWGKETTVSEITKTTIKTVDGGKFTQSGKQWGHGTIWHAPYLENLDNANNQKLYDDYWLDQRLRKLRILLTDEAYKCTSESALKAAIGLVRLGDPKERVAEVLHG